MNTSVTSFFLGRVPYEPALYLQKAMVNLMKLSGSVSHHSILLLEHTPVYTIGVRQKDLANDYSEAAIASLRKLGAEFVRTDRGGLITYHGPGQLVAYPLINLRCTGLRGRGLRWYVNALEQTGVQLCAHFGCNARPGGDSETGVWLSPVHKVMAIGVHKSGSIMYHGVAVNCSTEPLSWLRRVVPCGLTDRDVISLSEGCKRSLTVSQVAPILSNCLVDNLFCPQVVSCYRDDLTEYTGNSWSDVMHTILNEYKSRCTESKF